MSEEITKIVYDYVHEIQKVLGKDFLRAVIYGSYARGEYGEDSDIDIAIFTHRKAEEFYQLIDAISELTFEYDVKYDVMLSPVFQNEEHYNRMLKVIPYYQSIQKEGVTVGERIA